MVNLIVIAFIGYVICFVIYTYLVRPCVLYVRHYFLLIYLGQEETLRRKETAEVAKKQKKAYQEYLSLLPDEQLEQLIRQKVKEKSKAKNKEEIKVWRNLYFGFGKLRFGFSSPQRFLGVLVNLVFFITCGLAIVLVTVFILMIVRDGGNSRGILLLLLLLLPSIFVFWVVYRMRRAIRCIFYQDMLIKEVINDEIHRIKHKKFNETRLNWEPPECHETSMIIVKN